MKKTMMIALMMLMMLTTSAQEAIFKKYAGQDGISVVNISKSMLGMMSGMAKGNNKIKGMAGKLERIRILNCENESLVPKVKKDALEYVGKKGYEELMSSQEKGELVYILRHAMSDGNYEYVVINIEPAEVSVINIIGKLTLDEIQSISSM